MTEWLWAEDQANPSEGITRYQNRINRANKQIKEGTATEELKKKVEEVFKPRLEKLNEINGNKELLEQAKQNERVLGEKLKNIDKLREIAEKDKDKFLKDLPGKLKRNKKLAWGVGLGTAALGSLGAYGYYKNKKKNK